MKRLLHRKIEKAIVSIVLSAAVFVGTLFGIPVRAEETAKESKNDSRVFSVAEQQQLSLNMLNYMTVLTQEINQSDKGKRYLDTVYSGIVNNVNPNAVDERTLAQILTTLDVIKQYRSIRVKREHLDYLYKQTQAQAMRSALPNPLSILNVVQSGNPYQAMLAAVYMVFDAKAGYDSYVSEAGEKYLQDGWELDEEEQNNLSSSREALFEYMVQMVQKYDLDGKKALNEESAAEFAAIEKEKNTKIRISRLENKKDIYEGYGKYWLTLAESYYDDGQFQKCMDAIDSYPDLGILRFDRDYAKALSIAISAAKQCCSRKEYEKKAIKYLENILNNIDYTDWALRYYAAQVYLDLADGNGKSPYTRKAFELAKENVTELINYQKELNKTYCSELKKVSAPEGADKKEKKEIRQFNKLLAAERKTELPPVYQPLVVNCELMFELAKKEKALNLSDDEKNTLLQYITNGEDSIFFNKQLQNQFSFADEKTIKPDISFDGNDLRLNATLLEAGSSIKVLVKNGEKEKTYKKWKLKEVDRDKSEDPNKFVAIYECKDKKYKKQKYDDGSIVVVEICPPKGASYEKLSYQFKVSKEKKLVVFQDEKYEMVN